ncbi:MAG TPA: ATP-grasp domain-containing protein [Streptomyces sp.]|nr:ATP-grasp domain-containing protein [Streptomyces sp.]
MSDRGGPAVIVDPFSSGGLYAPAFRAAGIPVVAVNARSEVLPTYLPTYHPEDFDQVLAHDGDLDALLERLRPLGPRCVLPGAESGVELADLLAAALTPEQSNVPGLAAARVHKGEMAAAARAAGLPVIRQITTDDPEEAARWLERNDLIGHDLVVKPPRSASTDGVTRVRENWREVFEEQLGRANQWDVVNEKMMLMEYATGTEYVVDVFSHDGRHTVTDVCRYGKVDNGAHMAVYDSMEWVAPDDPVTGPLIDYTRRFLDGVGFRYGAAHVELMLTADGPRLIELNARPHGGGQPRYCRAATGDSQIDRAVRLASGGGPLPDGYRLDAATVVVFLISRTAGVVGNTACFEELRTLESYHEHVLGIRDGDRLVVTKDLLTTLGLGFVVLSSPDREQVWKDYDRVREIERGLTVS